MACLEPDNDFNDAFYQKHNEAPEKFCFKNGKLSFPTKTQAKKKRQNLELKYHSYFEVYQCPHCDAWHLTTTDKQMRQRIHERHQR